MRKLNMKPDAAAFIKVLPYMHDVASTLADWRAEGEPLTIELCEAILAKAAKQKQPDVVHTLWAEVIRDRAPVNEEFCKKSLRVLADAHDTRIFAMLRESKSICKPTREMIFDVLRVSSYHRSATAAKEMWRELQSQNLVPNEETLRLLLQSCTQEPNIMGEVYEVIKASRLPLPPGTETFVLDTFAKSPELSRRIPEVRSAYNLPSQPSYSTGSAPAPTPPSYPPPRSSNYSNSHSSAPPFPNSPPPNNYPTHHSSRSSRNY
eukprot:NODE_6311_length_900_cov_40.198198_g5719_i0.p1 GENE.NODE_6311_length_900_cov_40.198198_g5719_i0~~NODE_6311_length_900_cov_40.198198_g5719_i0.p1  ORF type:complete len:280 (-),score=52.15 NODE_6311_length_900_cov_40.198198_g5719_i0:61-849(-)